MEGRGEGRITGPRATPKQLGDQARPGQHPRFTEELRSGVDLGTPTDNTKTRQENGRIAGRWDGGPSPRAR